MKFEVRVQLKSLFATQVTTPAPALMTAELQLQVDAQTAAAVYEKVVDETTGIDCYRVGGVGLGQSKVSSLVERFDTEPLSDSSAK